MLTKSKKQKKNKQKKTTHSIYITMLVHDFCAVISNTDYPQPT